MSKKTKKTDQIKKKAEEKPTKFELNLGILHPYSGGIDIGGRSIFVSYQGTDGILVVKEVDAFTGDLNLLSKELRLAGITNIAMEATGVYWMPVHEILSDAGINVSVVNPKHYKNVDAEKTDIKDCQWLHQLHAHGLMRNSFIAQDINRELRSYIHERNNLQDNKSKVLNQIHRTLTQLNIKVQHLVSDIEGVIGMQIIRRIANGIFDPKKILEGLNISLLKSSIEDLEKSLEGLYKQQYIIILCKHLEAYDFYKKQMLDFELLIENVLKRMMPLDENQNKPFIEKKKKLVRKNQYHVNIKEYLIQINGVDLTAIDGIDEICALQVLAVIGNDMSKWKSAQHFSSWLNLAPRPKISGGKILGYEKRFTKNPATQALRMAAQTMWQNKGILGSLYKRLSATKGSKKAIKAVACRLSIIIYHMLKNKTEFDPNKVALDNDKIKARKIARLKKEATKLGLTVSVAA